MTGKYRVQYSPAALDDLKDIYTHIATELYAPETASKQIHRINEEICSLDFMPCRYLLLISPFPEKRYPGSEWHPEYAPRGYAWSHSTEPEYRASWPSRSPSSYRR